jgi:hypothetical protein
MVNTTEICCTAICTAISIGILMALSSSVSQTTREKVSFETVYADRVGKVYGDRFEKVYTDRNGQPIYCDARGVDCIRPCGVATCAVVVFPPASRTAQPAQGQPETPRPSPR